MKIEKKKDGNEYSRLSQGLKNGFLGKYTPIEDGLHPYITIYTRTEHGNYIDDNLAIFHFLDELPDTDERKKDYRRQVVRQTTPMTNDEIREKINYIIERYKTRLETYKKDLENSEKAYNNYKTALENAEKQLLKDTGHTIQNSSALYYAIKY